MILYYSSVVQQGRSATPFVFPLIIIRAHFYTVSHLHTILYYNIQDNTKLHICIECKTKCTPVLGLTALKLWMYLMQILEVKIFTPKL